MEYHSKIRVFYIGPLHLSFFIVFIILYHLFFTSYTNSNNYSQSNQNESSNQDSEFQFFAGCNTWEEVKLRYRDLMKIYHPDAGGNEDASKRINAEYNALKAKFGK